MTPLTVTFAEFRSLRFCYARRGSGPPLLFIGGTGGDLRRPETGFWGPLADHFGLVTYDQRGMGQSLNPDRTPPDVPWTMADYADDAAGMMDFIGWDGAPVVGVSFGGMVAQELALRHPARVRRLILCCTSSGGAGGASFAYHHLPPMTREERAALLIPLFDTRHDAAWQAAHPARYQALLAAGIADPFAGEPGHAEGARRQEAARAGHDSWARLAQIRCPTLVMGGRHDAIAPPQNLTALAGRIAGAELGFFEGGHLFMLADPRAYPAMIEFLNR